MDLLCGNETFWDLQQTWYSEWPQFSACFQNVVLTCGPCVALWTAASVYLPWLLCRPRHSGHTARRQWLLWAKQTSCCVLLVLSLVSVFLVLGHVDGSRDAAIPPAEILAPCVRTATMLLVLMLPTLERRRDDGGGCNACLWLFWLLVVVADVVPAYTHVIRRLQGKDDGLAKMAVFYLTFTFEWVQLCLHSVSDIPYQDDKSQCPESTAPFPSWLTFTWMNRLMSRGYRHELHENDVFPLAPRDQMLNASEKLDRNRVILQPSSGTSKQESDHTVIEEKTPLLSTQHRAKDSSQRQVHEDNSSGQGPPRLVLVTTLLKTYIWSALVSNACKLPFDLLLLTNPLLLGQLIRLCDDTTTPQWRGYVIGIAMVTSLMLQSLLFQMTFHLSMTLGLRVKAALTAAIFKKVLTVASKGRRESAEGEMINLLSVDTNHVTIFLSFLPYAWSGPLQVALAVYCLQRTIGLSALAGAGLLLLLLPLNGVLMSRLGNLQTTLMEHKDTRLDMVTQILANIKTVKVNAWERVLSARVSRARDLELHVLRRIALLDASQTVLWTLAPFFMALLTFCTHVFTDVRGTLTSEEVFVTLSYLNILRGAVTVAPMLITDIVKAAVSMKRLERFLNHEDVNISSVTRDPKQEAAVVMQDITCSWDREAEPCIRGTSLRVAEGSLVAVVGPMGSGKTSLLAAILGELHVHSGHVTVNCAASYVPHQAWLPHSTVRANILGLNPHPDNPRYQATLRACALTSDLQRMPDGDMTDTGEHGVALSGGQRQRISLARAVYESRDLYLMDDPISAVDNRVGRQIFRDLIGQNGRLRDATRIVTTSTYHWLPEADVIVVLEQGRVVEVGPWEQLMAHDGHLSRVVTSYSAPVPAEQGQCMTLTHSGAHRLIWNSQAQQGDTSEESCSAHQKDSLGQTQKTNGTLRPRRQLPPVPSTDRAKPQCVNIADSEATPSPEQQADSAGKQRASAVHTDTVSFQRQQEEDMISFGPALTITDTTKAQSANAALGDAGSPPEPPEDSDVSSSPCDLTVPRSPSPTPSHDSHDDASGSDSDTLTERECSVLRTLVEHTEDLDCTRSATIRSRDHGSIVAMTTSQRGPWRKGGAVTSTSVEQSSRTGRRQQQTHTLLDEEHVHVGKVQRQVYAAIARALGVVFIAIMAVSYSLYHVSAVGANYWLSYWTDVTSLEGREEGESRGFYLGVYSALGLAQCIFTVTFALTLAVRRVRASRCLHSRLLHSVLFSPLPFFHRHPAARVLSRMSRDLEVVDVEVWFSLEVVLESLCYVISTCVVMCLGSPWYLLALLPTAAVYYFVQCYYVATSRQLRRLESKTRSPVFKHLSHTAAGSVVLRAAGPPAVQHALHTAATLVDRNLSLAFASNTATRWLGVRMATIGLVIVGVATVLGVAWRETGTAGMVGLTITYALDVTDNLNWLVRMLGDMETNAVAVERILDFSDLTPEQDDHLPTVTPSQEWPSRGCVHFQHLSARYTSVGPPVLTNITCTIKPGEKVGVVGRTGAGKTSLWGVIVGLLTSTEGSVLIDDVDTRSVPLQELRQRVAVLPQEPFILDGSVRLNLDPEGVATDDEMWAVLTQTQLANHVHALPGALNFLCQSNGHGFSTGQRQLLCLARILLRHCRVVILDEATSSVDRETDDIICKVLQQACADVTVLIISHRLSTVMHCDRVMVMEGGRVVEEDSPTRLLADPFSHFSRLAASSHMMH